MEDENFENLTENINFHQVNQVYNLQTNILKQNSLFRNVPTVKFFFF